MSETSLPHDMAMRHAALDFALQTHARHGMRAEPDDVMATAKRYLAFLLGEVSPQAPSSLSTDTGEKANG